MFELDEAILGWRHSFGEAMRAEDLDELEEHLRAEVAVLERGELSAEEAYLVAARRLGGKGELEHEFTKVHGDRLWIRPVQWMVLGFLGIHVLVRAFTTLGNLTLWATRELGVVPAGAMAAQALVQFLGLALLVWLFFSFVLSRASQGRSLVVVALVLALSTPLLLAAGLFVQLGQVRLLASEEFGSLVMYNSYVATAAAVLLPLVLFGLVLVLERKRRVT